MTNIKGDFIITLVYALFSLLIWRFYKDSKYSPRCKYDTFGPRFWTGTVDSCVLWPIWFLILVLLSLDLPGLIRSSLVIIQHVIWLAYSVVMHGKYGQTVGKMVCKVKVVDFITEGAITYRQAFLREGIPIISSFGIVAYEVFMVVSGRISTEAIAKGDFRETAAYHWLSALPLIWFVAEIVTMLTNDKRRALHDFIAGTVSIRTNLESTEAELVATAPQVGHPA